MVSDDSVKNIWELYGVKDNPFSTSPILVKGGTLPIECFVGRTEHIKRLGKILGSKGGSRTLVYGDIGVGKTSFVNVVRQRAMDKGLFTPFKEIAIQEDWTSNDFILNTLASFYATFKVMPKRPINDVTFKKLETLFEIGAKDLQVGASILGIGGNYGEQTKQTNVLTTLNLQGFFQDLVNEITSGNKEIIIHYNNLELLNEHKIKQIFNNIRDFIQVPKVHFIFIGNLSTHSVIQSMPRVSSILTDTPIHIENLKLSEVEEIIIKRFENLKIDNLNYVIPYTPDCLKVLYELMEGNIRHILNSLSTAVLEETNEKAVVIDESDLARILKKVLDERYMIKLTNKAKEVLIEIVKHREITNKTLSDKLGIPPSNTSQYLKDLQNEGCIYLRRKNGKDKFWSAEHRIKWALLKEKGRTLSLRKFF